MKGAQQNSYKLQGGMPATNLLPGGEAVESGMCIKPDWFDKQTVCIFCEQFIDRAGL